MKKQQKTKAKTPDYLKQPAPEEFNLKTGAIVLPFLATPMKRELNITSLKTFIRKAGLGTVDFYYVKAEKRLDYNKDGICFFDDRSSAFQYISLRTLATGLNVDEEEYKTYLPKKVVGAKKLSKKAAKAKEKEDIIQAKLKLLGRTLHRNLSAKTKAEILDFNYWINYAISNLGVVPPTETEVDARLIKTYKIYAIAFQVKHKIPVKIVREMLRALSATANTIVELPSYDKAKKVLRNIRESTVLSESGNVINHEVCVDVKCQLSNTKKKYAPSTLITGYETYDFDAEANDYVPTFQNVPVLSDDLAFLAEVTEISYYSATPEDVKLLSDTLYFYTPIMSEAFAKKKNQSDSMSLNELIRIAYEIAISINYTISRVDFF